jgi:hypothetical protein
MMTGRPSVRAARSLPSAPPEFFVTSTSVLCCAISARSAVSAKGPRPVRISAQGGNSAGSGGSTLRIM